MFSKIFQKFSFAFLSFKIFYVKIKQCNTIFILSIVGNYSYRFFDAEHESKKRIFVSHKGFKKFETKNFKKTFFGYFLDFY